MKNMFAAGAFALSMLATSAMAQDATTTVVQPNNQGGYSVDTTRSNVDAYGNSVKVNTDVNTDPAGGSTVTKRVERDSTDAYGNQSKEITDHVTDATGKQTTTRYEQSTSPNGQ